MESGSGKNGIKAPKVLYYPGEKYRVVNFDIKSSMLVKDFNVNTKRKK